MLAMDITLALGTSIMAFVLGVLIGTSLGYLIWAEKDAQNNITNKTTNDRLTALEKDSPTEQQRREDNEPK